jgi:hypothetical protein
MKVFVVGKGIQMLRDEKDAPAVPRPLLDNPKSVSRRVYNSWRTSYYLSFDSVEAAKAAAFKIEGMANFDEACVWLDKQ